MLYLLRLYYEDSKPLFIGVSEILKKSTDNTVTLLKQDLEVKLDELENQYSLPL